MSQQVGGAYEARYSMNCLIRIFLFLLWRMRTFTSWMCRRQLITPQQQVAMAMVVPPWLSQREVLMCNFMHALHMFEIFQWLAHVLLRTKGPPEKVNFPVCSETTNPFQLLPSFLMILGRKIDGASQMKETFKFAIQSKVSTRVCLIVLDGQEKLDLHQTHKRASEHVAQGLIQFDLIL